jgi:hypothetical protein
MSSFLKGPLQSLRTLIEFRWIVAESFVKLTWLRNGLWKAS